MKVKVGDKEIILMDSFSFSNLTKRQAKELNQQGKIVEFEGIYDPNVSNESLDTLKRGDIIDITIYPEGIKKKVLITKKTKDYLLLRLIKGIN